MSNGGLKLLVDRYELNWINSWLNYELKNLDKESNEYKALKYLQVKVEIELDKEDM